MIPANFGRVLGTVIMSTKMHPAFSKFHIKKERMKKTKLDFFFLFKKPIFLFLLWRLGLKEKKKKLYFAQAIQKRIKSLQY